MKLNLGCGKQPLAGWTNVDSVALPGVDVVWDIETPMPHFAIDSVDKFHANHVLEHLANPLAFMQECWRIAKPDALFTINVPYGSSDNAWEDPTHKRPYFLNSWLYFSQAPYTLADYSYRGDWATVQRTLVLDVKAFPQLLKLQERLDEVMSLVMTTRNMILEMRVVLRAIKPARIAGNFRESAPVTFAFGTISDGKH